MKLIDTHSHIYYDSLSENLDDVINRASDNNVHSIICVGTDLISSETSIQIAEKYPNVYATVGIHPHEASKVSKSYLNELENFLDHPKVVAVGEMGLDYYYEHSERKIQNRVYLEQLEFAKSFDMPAVVHCRESDEDILSGIEFTHSSHGVIHCFASNLDFAQKIINTGFSISFTGVLTFVKELEEVVREIPLEKLLIETDAPYLSPKPFRGKTNEPAYVKYIAEKIAEIKNIPINDVAKVTTENALSLFAKINA
jgi:TatD DNase family protein